jgi:hypothetical protein
VENLQGCDEIIHEFEQSERKRHQQQGSKQKSNEKDRGLRVQPRTKTERRLAAIAAAQTASSSAPATGATGSLNVDCDQMLREYASIALRGARHADAEMEFLLMSSAPSLLPASKTLIRYGFRRDATYSELTEARCDRLLAMCIYSSDAAFTAELPPILNDGGLLRLLALLLRDSMCEKMPNHTIAPATALREVLCQHTLIFVIIRVLRRLQRFQPHLAALFVDDADTHEMTESAATASDPITRTQTPPLSSPSSAASRGAESAAAAAAIAAGSSVEKENSASALNVVAANVHQLSPTLPSQPPNAAPPSNHSSSASASVAAAVFTSGPLSRLLRRGRVSPWRRSLVDVVGHLAVAGRYPSIRALSADLIERCRATLVELQLTMSSASRGSSSASKLLKSIQSAMSALDAITGGDPFQQTVNDILKTQHD